MTTGAALTTLGVVSTAALDIAIDRSGHDHDHPAFRYGRLPTRVLAGMSGALGMAAVGATLLPSTRAAAPTLARLSRAAAGAWLATETVRYGTGMLFSPRGRGVDFAPGDLARNAVDRIHMMGESPRPHERLLLSVISQLQGHGSYEERFSAGDFMPAP